MAQTNYTPISLYYSTTASAVPTAANLVQGELAINTNDGKLYYEDSSGVVQVLATKSTGSIGGSNTQVQFNNSGSLGGSSGLTWDGSFLTTSSIKNSALTSGRVTFAGASGLLSDSANLTYGTGLSVNGISQVFQTGLFSTDGTLSNYSVNNGVYLNGNATGWSQLSGDGTRATFVRVWGSGASPANFIAFNTAGSERMRVDSSGNVGIGTTSAGEKLTIDNGASGNEFIRFDKSTVFQGLVGVTQNAAQGSSDSLAGDLIARSQSGRVLIDTAGSTRMTITNAGLVGIGTSSPNFPLNIYSSTAAIAIQNATTGSANTDGSRIQLSGSDLLLVNRESANLALYTADTERMRIDSSGNLLVGGTSALVSAAGRGNITINGTSSSVLSFGASNVTKAYIFSDGTNLDINNQANGYMTFDTNALERMRIDTSGNLLVGTTTTAGKFCVTFNGAAENGTVYRLTANSSDAGYVYYQDNATNTCGSVVRVGTTSAVVYNTTSDYRLKTVIGAVTGQGERIDALKPIDYQWKEGNQQARGFLAHEFQTVYPNSVAGDKDAVDANGNPKYQAMQAGTAEVIADLVAEIQSLRQRITTLENK